MLQISFHNNNSVANWVGRAAGPTFHYSIIWSPLLGTQFLVYVYYRRMGPWNLVFLPSSKEGGHGVFFLQIERLFCLVSFNRGYIYIYVCVCTKVVHMKPCLLTYMSQIWSLGWYNPKTTIAYLHLTWYHNDMQGPHNKTCQVVVPLFFFALNHLALEQDGPVLELDRHNHPVRWIIMPPGFNPD